MTVYKCFCFYYKVLGFLLEPVPSSHCRRGPDGLVCFSDSSFPSGPLAAVSSSGSFLLVGEAVFSQLIIILLLAEG